MARICIQIRSHPLYSEASEESSTQIIADIQSDVDLSEVILVWEYNQNRYPCPTRQQYVNCTVNGSQYEWTVRLTAPGPRPFYVEATDQNGQVSRSEEYQIDVKPDSIEESMSDQTPPVITLIDPNWNTEWYENTEVQVNADIRDPSGIESAFLRWDFNGNDYPCPYASQYVDCEINDTLYQWRVRVNQGERTFRIWAKDLAGNSIHSDSYSTELLP